MKEKTAASSGNKLTVILVVLLVVASFLIGSLFTQVNLLKKGAGTPAVTNTGTDGNAQPAAAGAGDNQPPPTVKVDVDISGAPALGNKNAKIALVEFTDFQCPFCGQMFTQTFPSIKKEYIDTGKIKYVVRDFPLTQLHPYAQKAAEASHCADEQGKFWEYHDKLFANQQALTVDDLKKYAADLGLNTGNFNSCVDSSKYADRVAKDQKAGETYGVRGTPSSYVGVIEGNIPSKTPCKSRVQYRLRHLKPPLKTSSKKANLKE